MGIDGKVQEELLEIERQGAPVTVGFNRTERLMMRQLVTDRVADRFRMAQKAAEGMDIVLLKSCVDELVRLDELAVKLTVMEATEEGCSTSALSRAHGS